MKKIYLVLFMLISFGAVQAQTTLSTATDFTVTDTHGSGHNLFNILASGKYVCLDFFFTTCGPCQATCPYYKQTFTNYGCNTQDVYFMSIDLGNTDAEVDAYEVTYLGGSSGYPAVSGSEGGGDAVVSAYGITAFPTYILIAPDHSIIEQDMWPISSAASFDTYFNAHSLVYKSCLSGIEESALDAAVIVFPNPAHDLLNIELGNGEKLSGVKVMDGMGRLVIDEAVNAQENYQVDISKLASGVYSMEILSVKGERIVRRISKQ